MGQAEAKVQTAIINFLSWVKAFVFKTIASNKGGIPDVIACVPLSKSQVDKWFETHDTIGLFVAIEVKKPGGKPDPLQIAQLRKIRDAGGEGFSADNIDKVKDQLYYVMES